MLRSTEITGAGAWKPFQISTKGDVIRELSAAEGVADRLRVVAFAELQARDAFRFGAERFIKSHPQWCKTWIDFAMVEDRHAQMLLSRMDELGIDPSARKVSDKLFKVCSLADDPITFLFILASAEERGMEAGFILGEQMKKYDEKSASIFQIIAEEEVEHVKMATDALKDFDYLELKERAKKVNALLL